MKDKVLMEKYSYYFTTFASEKLNKVNDAVSKL